MSALLGAIAPDPLVARVVAATLACLFASAAVHKLRDPDAFRSAVAAYELVPERLARRLAAAFPWLELTGAALALAEPSRRIGLALLTALLAVYAGAMALALLQGRRELDCGCFGPAHPRPIGSELVVRNLVLAALGGVALLPAAPRPLVPLDLATGVGAVAAALLLLAAVDRALANAPALRALRG